jgi:hypothetical protein
VYLARCLLIELAPHPSYPSRLVPNGPLMSRPPLLTYSAASDDTPRSHTSLCLSHPHARSLVLRLICQPQAFLILMEGHGDGEMSEDMCDA